MSTSHTLVLGGIRSGKSEFAETLLTGTERVAYLATAPSRQDDVGWRERVAAHLRRRPEHWTTEEYGADPSAVGPRLSGAKPDETLLVDDLGGWLAAVLDRADGWRDPRVADDQIDALLSGLTGCPAARVVLVSPEVGLSVVPATESGRTFADELGRLNRLVASIVDEVTLVVAGQPVPLKGGPDAGRSARAARRRDATPAAAGAPGAEVLVGAVATPTTVDASGAPTIGPALDLPMPDETSAAAATAHLGGLDFPGAGLGALASVVTLAGGTQRHAVPRPWEDVRVLVLHGLHAGGAAAGDDPDAAARQLDNAHRGIGVLALLAADADASVRTVECPPAAPMEEADALTPDEVAESLAIGWRLADSAADEGTDALVLGALGVGSEAAAVATCVLAAGGEPAALLDRVTAANGHIDDNAWMVRCLAVRDALHRVRGRPRDPHTMLANVGGGDIAVATGVILGATFRRTPVFIDGPVGIAAALVARDLAAQTRHWLALPDHGGHPLVRYGGDTLGLTPLLHLRLRLGEGGTSLAALPLLRTALTLARGTPTAP